MPKQEFEFIDYLAAPILAVIFSVILFAICVTINFTLITKKDDLTSFEKVCYLFLI